MTVLIGNDNATLTPPETVRFKIRLGFDWSLGGGQSTQSGEFDRSGVPTMSKRPANCNSTTDYATAMIVRRSVNSS